MAGAGAGSFGAGFAKGLANVLLSNRQEQTRKAERQQDVDFRNFSSTFPIIFSNFQQNPTPEGAAALEDMIVRINPEMAKQIRRGGFSFETLGPLLSQGGAASQGQQTQGQITPGNIDLFGQPSVPNPAGGRSTVASFSVNMDGKEYLLSSVTPDGRLLSQEEAINEFKRTGRHLGVFDSPASATAYAQQLHGDYEAGKYTQRPLEAKHGAAVMMPDQQTRLFGTPVLSQQQKTEQAIKQQGQIDVASVQRARDVLAEMRKTNPAATLEDAFRVIGVEFPASQQRSSLIEVAPESSLYDPVTKQSVFTAPARKATTTGGGSEIDDLVASYAREHNIPIDQIPTDVRLKLSGQLAASKRAPEQAGENVSAVAELAAINPAILQDKTPSFQGAVIAEIAKNPVLKARWTQARMTPIRETAKQMVSALDKLLTTDAQGKVTGLTSGAKALFGEFTPVMGRDVSAGVSDLLGGGGATDALAALSQVAGQQVLDLIGTMKQQSQTGATGFGQLSVPELEILLASASQLNKRLSEDAALAELTKLHDKFKKILIPSAAEMGGPEVNVGDGSFSVTHGGKTYTFQSQGQLDLFKRRAGIQ